MDQIVSRFKSVIGEPLLLIAPLWPLVLLTPHLPGIPRASVNGLPWRQELALTILLFLISVCLLKSKGTESEFRINRNALLPLAAATLFLIWILLSAGWSVDRYQALHLGIQWTSYLVFFGFMTWAMPAKVIRSSFITLAIVIWVLVIACAIESWFGAPLTDFSLRNDLKPVFRGFSGFGEITGATSILFAAFALHLNRRRIAFICGATAIAGWLATLQSLERAPLVGASAGFLLLCTGTLIRPSRGQLKRIGLLIGALALVLWWQTRPAMPPSASTSVAGEVSTVTRLRQDPVNDQNTRVRLLFWGIALEMSRAHPLLGVGANNYQAKYAEARAQFAARNPNSDLIAMNEDLLSVYAHNEYLQMLAELGLVGFVLFALFSLALFASFLRALKVSRHRLPILGAAGAMLAFAISSGASAASFRFLGGGLIFFFAGALISRSVHQHQARSVQSSNIIHVTGLRLKSIKFGLCSFMLVSVCLLTAQAAGSTLQALAERTTNQNQAERYYRASLQVYPASTSAYFDYGMWLSGKGRWAESVRYLEYAVERGFNSSVCYEFLAAAQGNAGDLSAAERTFATAVRVYPRSIFLLVRHSVALERLGRNAEAETEFSKALLVDSRAARGWQHLIVDDIDAAYVTATHATNIALPGELTPEAALFSVLRENERRFPGAVNTGWRVRMRSARIGSAILPVD